MIKLLPIHESLYKTHHRRLASIELFRLMRGTCMCAWTT